MRRGIEISGPSWYSISKGSPIIKNGHMALDKAKINELVEKDLFKELDLQSLPAEDRAGVLDEMGKMVLEGIWLRIFDNLSAEDEAALEKVVDESESPEEIMKFLTGKIPNFEDVVKEEIANYKSILLGV